MSPRDQIYAVFKYSKWIIAISLFISGVLLIPNQIIELYRVSAINGLAAVLVQCAWLVIIALAIWLGAFQIAAQTLESQAPLAKWPSRIAHYLPALLGALPLFAAARAQFVSKPSLDSPGDQLQQVGSVFRIQYETLVGLENTLSWLGLFLFGVAILAFVAMSNANNRFLPFAAKANNNYFVQHRFLATTVAGVAVLTAAFIWFPVAVPRALSTFGVLALFTVCLTAVCVHLTLITIKHHLPFIPILFGFILLFSFLDLNDNHFIRPFPTKSGTAAGAKRLMAADAFAGWLQRRARDTARGDSPKTYPVFIVSVQGGGIYAAYNAAVFLARMQDLCPSFHNHVFAISAVSGGSIGAATFATALDAAGVSGSQPGTSSDDPCPRMTSFLSNAHANDDLDKVGNIEASVERALSSSSDFLSPLLAGSLFPDLAQSIIPYPLGFLDRSRALEYALEQNAHDMYAKRQIGQIARQDVSDSSNLEERNLLKERYQDHWTPTGAVPALLFNATDTGSGKRIVISPFDFKKSSATTDICVLTSAKSSNDFALSTAAFVSARFPWVTPAATTNIINDCISTKAVSKVRLVDGGYIDNSGVDTALDLIAEIQQTAASNNAHVYLISLSSGDFPNRRDYSFNELMEPIRALLNGREARAAIALNRAKTLLSGPSTEKGLPRFNRTALQNYFYDLPLGWAMSDRTRNIIALDSGRFWDCVPDDDFSQTDPHLSNADCVQLQVYHLLNNNSVDAMSEVRTANRTLKEIASLTASEGKATRRFDHESLLECYEDDWQERQKAKWQKSQDTFENEYKNWTNNKNSKSATKEPLPPEPYKGGYLAHYQAERVRELLNEWDRRTTNNDPAVLAYILGSIAHDSGDFRRTSDNLTYKTVAQIKQSRWMRRIGLINAARHNQVPPLSDVDLTTLTNKPMEFAELVWGWKGNDLGNNWKNGQYDPTMKDGWKYRSRGMYQIVGREQFQHESDWLVKTNPQFKEYQPINKPDVVSNETISAKIAFSHFINWKSHKITDVDPLAKDRAKYGLESKTLIDVLAKYPGDFEMARLNQHDMRDGDDRKSVAARSKMFQKCISSAEASLKQRPNM